MSFLITQNNSEFYPFKDHSYPCYKSAKGFNEKALNQLFTLTEKTLSHYSKAAIIRIDLHPSCFTENNKIISEFLTKQVNKFKKSYGCIVSYFYAREQSSSDKQHYHLALFFSGHKVNNAYKIEQQIKSSWEAHCSGTVHFVKKPIYLIERGNKQSIDPAIYRLSYLTKTHTKQNNGLAKSYGSSRLKYKNGVPESDILFVNPKITYENNYKSKNKSIYGSSIEIKPSKVIRTALSDLSSTENAKQIILVNKAYELEDQRKERVLLLDTDIAGEHPP